MAAGSDSTRILHRLTTALTAARARPTCGPDELHLSAALEWLLCSQRSPVEGYAHSYNVLRGWLPPYPETTGYIVPTMLAAAARLQREELRFSAIGALLWLYSIQSEEGSFGALSGQPLVFDSGQILIGMNAVRAAQLPQYRLEPHLRLARWLVRVQASDGSFPVYAYRNRPHTYYSRVGAALLVAGQLLGDPQIEQAGRKNLDWTVGQLGDNGFFLHSSFDTEPAYLHTIVYVLEGLLDGYDSARQPLWREAALACAAALHATLPERELPRSQYRPDWSVANPQYCVTGLAQWAGVCLRLGQDHGEVSYLRQADLAIDHLKRWQYLCQPGELYGGLPGSVPVHGRYMRFAIPNWGVKFFADALLRRRGSSA